MYTSLMNQPFLFLLLGGLGLFLFGLKFTAEALQRAAGPRLRQLLKVLTGNRLTGLLTGMGMTAVIQSSTVAAVVVAGFVNSGLISLLQAIAVTLGIGLGTTVTGQLLASPLWHFGLPLIAIGAVLRLSRRNRWLHELGEVVLGAGLIFFALFLLRGACEPLRDHPGVQQLLGQVGARPLLGVGIGALLTMLLQSGTATIGLTIALAGSGLLGFEAGAALVLGECLGTALTVTLATLGTTLAARRAALAQLIFSLFGVSVMLLLFPWFTATVDALTPGEPEFVVQSAAQLEVFAGDIGDRPFLTRHIVNAHTLLQLLIVLLFLPLVGQLARLTARLLPGSEESALEFHLNFLDSRVMNTPPIALAQGWSELRRMAELTGEVVAETVQLLGGQRLEQFAAIRRKEELVDRLQRELTDFLVALSRQSVTAETSREVAILIHAVNDLERISDHCVTLGHLVERKLEQHIVFSAVAKRELSDMAQLIVDFYALVAKNLKQEGKVDADLPRQFEDAIDRSEEQLRNNHIRRLNTGECTVVSGLIFIDMLHNLEKIGDHCFNLNRALSDLGLPAAGAGPEESGKP